MFDANTSSTQSMENFTLSEQSDILNDEKPGQLYAYRYNETTVVLGTRDAKFLGADVGIGPIASGSYVCRTINNNCVSVEKTLVVNVNSKFVKRHM